jgi:hypothetical protein
VAAEFEFTSSELSANVIQRFHGVGYWDYSGSFRSLQHEGGRTELHERGVEADNLLSSCNARSPKDEKGAARCPSCSQDRGGDGGG